MPGDAVICIHDGGSNGALLAEHSSIAEYQTFRISKNELYASLPLQPESRCIRVLDLKSPTHEGSRSKSDGCKRSDLTAHIRTVNLDDERTFTALSYVWGEGLTHEICCYNENGSTSAISITSSCYAALCAVKEQSSPVTIWVDSICINQADEAEKVSQIPLMGEIYTSANTVYVWIGEGDERHSRAISYIKSRAAIMPRLPFGCLGAFILKQKRNERLNYVLKVLCDPLRRMRLLFDTNRATLSDVHCLLDCEWVHRSWTFQELILATNPVLLCGHNILPWADIVSAMYLFDEFALTYWPSSATVDDRGGDIDPIDDVDLLPGMELLWFTDTFRQLYQNKSMLLQPDGGIVSRWRNIADIWVSYPRPRLADASSPSDVDESGTDAQSFRTVLLERSWLPHYMRYLYWSFGIPLYPMMMVWPYIFIVPTDPKDDTSPDLHAFLIMLNFAFALFLGPLILNFGAFVFTGLRTHRYLKPATTIDGLNDRTVVSLSGVQQALRSRVSSITHDRAFATFGILNDLGARLAPPDYKSSAQDCFLGVFEHLIRWRPYLVAMILDAGGAPQNGYPSWLPNWGRSYPSPWLSFKHHVDSHIRATPFGERPECQIDGSKMMVQAHCKGSVTFQIQLARMNSRDDFVTLTTNVCALCSFIRQIDLHALRGVPYDYPEDYLFAVLHGLYPARKACTREVSVGNYMEDEDEMVEISAEPWEAPYDFTSRKDEYLVFCRLYSLLKIAGSSTGPRRRLDPVDSTIELVSRAVASKREYLDWFVNTMGEISDTERCFFILSNGMVGTGPMDMRKDDLIYLADGVPAPMALRVTQDEDDNFTVVGPALVHGIMRGSGFDRSLLSQITLV